MIRNLLPTFILLFSLSTALNAQSPIVAYHIENAAAFDLSGSNLHPQIIGEFDFVPDANGLAGGAIEFNGNAFLNREDTGLLDGINNMTISVWINLESNNRWSALVSKWNDEGFYFGINPDNNSVRFNIGLANVEDPTPVIFNEWIHFAASYNGSALKIYRNGALVNQVSITGPIANANSPLRIGGQSNVAFQTSIKGSMDEILIYDEALTDMAIEDLYNGNFQTYQYDLAVLTNENKVFTNQIDAISGQLTNLGSENISSFDLHWTVGTDTFSQAFTGLNIATNEVYDYTHSDALSLAIGDTKILTVWANNPNGMTDENSTNNKVESNIIGADFIPERSVLIEQSTRNSFEQSPRGILGFNYMADKYSSSHIGIAVHISDTLAIPNYNSGFLAFPLARVDRRDILIDPTPLSLEALHLSRLEDLAISSIDQELTYNEDSREISARVLSNFAIPANGEFRYILMIVENEVTGAGPAFDQANIFAGSTEPVGGFENLPDPIPADQMVYNRVVREVLGGLAGTAGSLPNSLDIGTTYEYTYNYTLPEELNEANINIVAVLFDIDGNEIINSISTPLSDATIFISNKEILSDKNNVQIFPNPTSGWTQIKLDLDDREAVSLKVFNTIGQEILSKDYGQLSGETILPFNTQNLENGMYVLNIMIGNVLTSRKLVVEK